MSSSRYPDSRYGRDRSPYRDRRASTYSSAYPPRASDSGPRSNPDSNGFPSRDTPRGPKSLVDSPRGPPPGAPSGPPSAQRDGRGRGFAGRSDTPSLRDAPPLSSVSHMHNSWRADRDRDRDRDFDRDRRDRRPSPRRSPVRDSRDSRDQRDFPRDLDISRARRDSRDGPLSAGSTYSDSPLISGSSYRGSGFGRGRGGRDIQADGRGRGRPFHSDDRDRHHDVRDRIPERSYRPRSRSREPVRRERDLRDDRDYDRRDRDDRRFQPREYDSYSPAAPKPGSRALDTHRGSTTLESRHLPSTPSGAVPHSTHHSPGDRLGPPADSYTRRPSVASESATSKDGRREPGRDDLLLASRAEASRERYAPRASSPPAAVPAFGSNVWRNPMLDAKPNIASQPSKPSAPSAPTPASSAAPAPSVTHAPTVPSVPKPSIPTGLSTAPPTGPKAERIPERQSAETQNQSQGPSPVLESRSTFAEQPRTESRPSVSQPAPASNALGPANTSAKPQAPASTAAPSSAPSVPAGPSAGSRPPPTGSQGALRANVSPSFPRPARLPYASSSRDASPGAMQPTVGSRSTSGSGPPSMMNSNTSPKSLPANIPTGPKADRNNPMGVRPPMYPPADRSGFSPRMPLGGPPKSIQWVRPGLNLNNRTTVPAKRELSEDRERPYGTAPKAPKLETSISASDPHRTEMTKPDSTSLSRPSTGAHSSGDRRAFGKSRKAPSPKPEPIENRRLSNVSMVDAPEKPPMSATSSVPDVLEDSDDDDLVLDEEDFAESEAKYNREKAVLESKRIDLSAPHLRATTPLQEIIMLASLTIEHLPQPEVKTPEKEMAPMPVSEAPSEAPSRSVVNELPTPKAEEAEEDVEMEDKGERQLAPATRALRLRHSTGDEREESPDLSSLPFLASEPLTPISELEGPRVSDSVLTAIRNNLQKSIQPEIKTEEALEQYATAYRQWRLHVRNLDDAQDTEPHERPASAEPCVTTPDVQTAAMGPILDVPPTSTTGRRGHAGRWATELDLELVLKESLKTAEQEREQHDKEPTRSMADPEKEADVPYELTAYEAQRRRFIDTNFQREPGQGIFTFHYEPPEDDFTEEEHQIMVYQYKDQYAKKWGKLAEILYKEAGTSRTYKDCINHYYATKWGREYKGKVRRRGGRRPRNPGRNRGAIANMDRPADPSGDDALPLALTESGRPRRSAAPTFGAETDPDTTASTPTTGRARRQTDADGTQEKVPRRGKAKEKVGRKAKAPPLALAPPEGSPVKVNALEVKMEGDIGKLGEIMLPVQTTMPDEQKSLSTDTQYQSLTGFERPKSQVGARIGHSSYWSVTEQMDFQRYVAHFGTDWAAIANHMGTKSQAMVKNQYQRLTENGQLPELERAAKEANMKKERGEDLGVPPAPTPAPKRRYESVQNPVRRTLAPTPEATTAGVPMALPKASSPSSIPPARFSNIAQAPQQPKPPVSGTPSSMPDSALVAIPQQQSPPVHAVHHTRPGPRAGFFSDEFPSRTEHRPSAQVSNVPPHSRALQPPAQATIQAHEQSQPPLIRTSSLQERDPVPKVEPRQDRDALNRPYQPEHSRRISGEIHHGRPFRPTTDISQMRAGPGARSPEKRALPLQQPRHVQQPLHQAPVQPPSSLPHVQHMQSRPSHATPPVKEEPKHHSMSLHGQPQPQHQPHLQQPPQATSQHHLYTPAPLPAQAAAPPPAPSMPKPAAEPRKSNLMSLLNDDQPEEPKKKKPTEQSIPSHTPTPQQQNPVAPPPPVSQALPPQRRDLYGEATTQSPYARPNYALQPGIPQVPVRQAIELTRDQAPSGRAPTREDWRTHGYPAQGQATPGPNINSPRASIQQPAIPAYNDRGAFLGNHRAFLAQHNAPRHNPSPPPLSVYSNSPHLHSRTPSLSAQGQQPHHGMAVSAASQHAQAATGASQILQPNPYAQVDPPGGGTPASGPVGMRPSPHLHTSHLVQRDLHSRNDQSQAHNGGLAYSNPQTPSEQHAAGQHMRTHSIVDPYRRDPRDLHREFDPRTADRDISREVSQRADALLLRGDRESSLISRSACPTTVHQDTRYQQPPGPPHQDRAYAAAVQQRSHTPLSRPDHGGPHPPPPPPLQHPPRSSLGDSSGHPGMYGGGPPQRQEDHRFRDPFAVRENNNNNPAAAHAHAHAHAQQREEYMVATAGHGQQRERERRERERLMGRGGVPGQGHERVEQRGADWASAVRRGDGGGWQR